MEVDEGLAAQNVPDQEESKDVGMGEGVVDVSLPKFAFSALLRPFKSSGSP